MLNKIHIKESPNTRNWRTNAIHRHIWNQSRKFQVLNFLSITQLGGEFAFERVLRFLRGFCSVHSSVLCYWCSYWFNNWSFYRELKHVNIYMLLLRAHINIIFSFTRFPFFILIDKPVNSFVMCPIYVAKYCYLPQLLITH